MTVSRSRAPDHHHPAYHQGVRVNEACTEARRIIEAAREGRSMGSHSESVSGYDKARGDQ